jgi:uncharacterized membrane protein
MHWFWDFMVVMNFIIPSVLFSFGLRFKRHAPKKINTYYGYRTERSMKNEETWIFAHRYFGKLWYRFSIILYILTIIWMLLLRDETVITITLYGFLLTTIQLGFMTYPILLTEKKLKETFDSKDHT